MCRKDRLSTFAEQIGFTVKVGPDIIVAEGVPCLLANRKVGSCTIEKSYDPESGQPDSRIGDAAHAVRITPNESHDGLVYDADGTCIGNHIGGDRRTWSNISIRKGSQDSPEDDVSPSDVIHRYAKQIVGAVSAAGYHRPSALTVPNPFKIPNTSEARAGIESIQNRIRDQRIAIVGLGGTGAYVLDLIAKTPVSEIHLLDADHADWHNFMRAPGAPTADEVASQQAAPFVKVEYYHSKYAFLREGIHAHAVRVDSSTMFAEFLSVHPVDYAFVCIDQRADSDSPRQDVVYAALSEAGVPFIDSGVSITLDNCAVGGAITTGAYAAGSLAWQQGVPNASVRGNLPGYRNVQLPEVNALAASLAVMEWRRRTGQYVSESPSSLHKFRLETPRIKWPDAQRCRP